MSVEDEKKRLRKRMRAMRLVADQKEGPGGARGVMTQMLTALDTLEVGPGSVVAGYWPIVTELDDRPLLARLDERGVICALPVVVSAGAPLLFRSWGPLDELEPGVLGTSHPTAAAPEVVPDVVLVPLLAFDRDGYRLGQGGGYYDRTLAALRSRGPLTAIGVGFAVQETDRVPRGANDERLDWVLTEEGLTQVRV